MLHTCTTMQLSGGMLYGIISEKTMLGFIYYMQVWPALAAKAKQCGKNGWRRLADWDR